MVQQQQYTSPEAPDALDRLVSQEIALELREGQTEMREAIDRIPEVLDIELSEYEIERMTNSIIERLQNIFDEKFDELTRAIEGVQMALDEK